jgi:hypothetical protein
MLAAAGTCGGVTLNLLGLKEKGSNKLQVILKPGSPDDENRGDSPGPAPLWYGSLTYYDGWEVSAQVPSEVFAAIRDLYSKQRLAEVDLSVELEEGYVKDEPGPRQWFIKPDKGGEHGHTRISVRRLTWRERMDPLDPYPSLELVPDFSSKSRSSERWGVMKWFSLYSIIASFVLTVFPHWGSLFQASTRTTGEAEIMASIMIMGGAILWTMVSRPKK